MPKFFCEFIEEKPIIEGDDALHISKSLRMKPEDTLEIDDTLGYSYICKISKITADKVFLDILEKRECLTEPSVNITLYQSVVKGDKADYIVQKCTELGVKKIVFLKTQRCVAKISTKNLDRKLARWNSIALSAAKQSGRGYIPKIYYEDIFTNALSNAKKSGISIFFYELAGIDISKATQALISKQTTDCSLFIGPEGGFSCDEAQRLKENAIPAVTLGERILRTETAPVSALSIIMYLTGNMS